MSITIRTQKNQSRLFPGINRGNRSWKNKSIKLLAHIHISEGFKNWAVEYLKEKHKEEIDSIENVLACRRKRYYTCLQKLNNLFQLKISHSNSNGGILSDEEYMKQIGDT